MHIEAAESPRATVRLSPEVQAQLRCPVCGADVSVTATVQCLGAACGASFPVVNGVPILLNEQRSIFNIDDFVRSRATTFVQPQGRVERLVQRLLDLLPDIGRSVGAARNYAALRDLLVSRASSPRVLVVGGSVAGEGMEALTSDARIELTPTDVAMGPETAIVSDAHDIPFKDGTFDGVVVQAVLEHVVDPHRCVEEVHRVLKEDGLVYAETPFMQQVHMGAFDFSRFTHSGHRALFRRFTEIISGTHCGPGMALAWSYQYFLLSFAASRPMRALIRAFASVTAFHLKYFDHYLVGKPAAIDAASGCFFLGRRSDEVMSDRDLVPYYRGAVRR